MRFWREWVVGELLIMWERKNNEWEKVSQGDNRLVKDNEWES